MARRASSGMMKRPAGGKAQHSARSRSPRGQRIPAEFKGMKALVVNLERRADRWERVQKMLQKETPWLEFEKFPATDGRAQEIPTEEVSNEWNTRIKAIYAGGGEGCEWVFEAPGTELDGKQWKWATEVAKPDDEWTFEEDEDNNECGTVVKQSTGEKFKVKYQTSKEYSKGLTQVLSAGERGCAHSHLRLWRVAAERADPTLCLEDDVQFVFERSEPKLGMSNGKVFTERLRLALKYAPTDFDVIYLGWSGWRGGNFKVWNGKKENGLSKEARKAIRRAEYVWTTVAYVISQAGAKKLLAAAKPVNMPVDEFMAVEACQGRLKSFVAVDKGDCDSEWAGGLVDQFDFKGDSDISKSDGGVQGDNIKDFAVITPIIMAGA